MKSERLAIVVATKDRPGKLGALLEALSNQSDPPGMVAVVSSGDPVGEVIERFTLLDEIWGIRYEGTTRTLDQHIAKLRQKIENDPAKPQYIQTIHGVGDRFHSST